MYHISFFFDVSGAFILFTDAKDKRFTYNILLHCGQELEWLIYAEKLSPFSLFASMLLII